MANVIPRSRKQPARFTYRLDGLRTKDQADVDRGKAKPSVYNSSQTFWLRPPLNAHPLLELARAARWAELLRLSGPDVLRADWGSLGRTDLGEIRALAEKKNLRLTRAARAATWLFLAAAAGAALATLTHPPETVRTGAQVLLGLSALGLLGTEHWPTRTQGAGGEIRSRLKPLDKVGLKRAQLLALSDPRADPYRLAVGSTGREPIEADLHRMEKAAGLAPDLILIRPPPCFTQKEGPYA
jgi:hypothetical protein